MRNGQFIGMLGLAAITGLGAGCVAHAQAGGYTDADAPVVFNEEPTLVAVEPGIWVVRDYDDSVYYVDGNYWVYRRDHWYRSPSYDRGWITVEVTAVPGSISHRDHRAYVHYKGAANAALRKAPRERTASAPDHDGPRRPEHGSEPHAGPPPGHDDRGEVGRPRGADDDHKREDLKSENERKRDDTKKDEKKREDHPRK